LGRPARRFALARRYLLARLNNVSAGAGNTPSFGGSGTEACHAGAEELVGFLGEFRHDEAVADVELMQGQQRCVALMPGTIGEVAGQPGDTVDDNALVE
jgi:hypothetical protein